MADDRHEARPCRCGSEALEIERVAQVGFLRCSGYRVRCRRCCHEGPVYLYEDDAVSGWNDHLGGEPVGAT